MEPRMTRINITDDTITIKRSDLPTFGAVNPYAGHDPANGAIAVIFGDSREFFHGLPVEENYEHWLPEQEQYILDDLAALIWAREVDAELGKSQQKRLLEALEGIDFEKASKAGIARLLTEEGWSL
jgi:hypothetical protein